MSWYCHTIRVEARGVRRVVKHRTSGGGHPVRVNPLFDDHLTHASAHTESLWLTRWARGVEGMGSAAARHAAGGGSIELRLVELGHPECHRDLERRSQLRGAPHGGDAPFGVADAVAAARCALVCAIERGGLSAASRARRRARRRLFARCARAAHFAWIVAQNFEIFVKY